ncbi:MAG: ATP synthase F0 subunit B [Planctomycetota bacterium]|nr:MAG: ATP synthase F0 subunit B [Planctomycetota bacterium]
MSVACRVSFLLVVPVWMVLSGPGLSWGAMQQAEAEHAAEELQTGEAGDDHADGGDAGHAAEAHGEVHIPHDVTAANLSPQTWEVVDFRTDVALFTAVVFLLLLAGLWGAAWKPIMLGLEKRERRIADNIARAEKAAADAEARLAEYESKLAAAGQEVQQMLAEARKDAEAVGQRMIAEAQEEAARLRDRAVADIDSAKRIALSELVAKSSELAFALARRVVQREIKPEDHQALIQELLAELPSNN